MNRNIAAPFLIAVSVATVAFGQNQGAPGGFENCRILADDQARLDCFKQMLARPSPKASNAEDATMDHWRLIRTPDPRGGQDAVAIMRTADTAQSDPDLAGLMIRCQQKQGFGVLLALVRPLPPLSKREVTIGSGAQRSVLRAEVSQAGTALILPIEATAFTTGPWQGLNELAVRIEDPETDIRGVIPLEGLAPALAKLGASCPSG